ncbi:MAG: GNAT family N-acetyltransferase [Lachnospiraceae bacterium]|nr:GNAT family N-acetyltransferase [Lachnospiraceae bacterium]
MTKEQIRFFEKIAANGYVGLEETEYDGWELRFTQGFTGRANSIQIKEPSNLALPEKVAWCEKAYAAHGLPCIFKLTDADTEFISFLEQRGYQAVKPTDVMLLALDDVRAYSDNDAVLEDVRYARDTDGWFEPYFAYEGLSDVKKQELTKKIHAKVSVDQIYIKIMQKDRVAAVASLAIESGYSLLHNVVVAPDLRGLGLGKKLCHAAILISKECGASHIYLQVMQNNPIAQNLYTRLGFEKQYTYYYVMNHANEFRKQVETAI